MRDRWFRKGSKNKYDPQIGEAAKSEAALAERTQQFNEDYFNKYVVPALKLQQDDASFYQDLNKRQADLDFSRAALADTRYRTLGIPAEDAYYQMVKDYSAPEEQEKQARAAIGDVRVAAQSQAGQQARQLRALGIDPTSPLALSAKTNVGLGQMATEAAAATRAREGAKTLGMQLTSDAANFGRGGFSTALQGAQQAQGGAAQAQQTAQQGVGAASGGAANVNTAQALAQKAYGANLDAYTSLGKSSIESYQSPLAAIGGLVGQVGAGWATGGFKPPSDRRLKKAARKVASLAHDIGLWMFRYVWEPDYAPLRCGYMADEVERVFPEAVSVDPWGFKRVDYDKVAI